MEIAASELQLEDPIGTGYAYFDTGTDSTASFSVHLEVDIYHINDGGTEKKKRLSCNYIYSQSTPDAY